MSKPLIEVKGLGKKYEIKSRRKVDTIRDLFSSPLDARGSKKRSKKKDFWALKDVSFELYPGDTLGIIGRNGAGKSTLLKILAQVIAPTEGEAKIRGRVASLLEVGTGFHPELTGKENVYFNGALLGMPKSEITDKFDEIVDFSEIKEFINTPIKHYSSGMRVRLAFSVAAHLDSDIMIIDEALSVGDVAFRQKSMEKMKTAAFDGRTVLFVTHSMSYVQDLCEKSIYLKEGRPVLTDETPLVIDKYLGQTRKDVGVSWSSRDSYKPENKQDQIIAKSLKLTQGGKVLKGKEVQYGEEVEVDLEVFIDKPHRAMSVGISLFDDNERRLFRSANVDNSSVGKSVDLKSGLNTLSVRIPTSFLRPGLYTVALDADSGKDWVIRPMDTEARVSFVVKNPTEFELWNPQREAMLKPMLEWHSK